MGIKKPKIIDLFCCAGGASMGLHRAGFDVTGVDIVHQKNYPFKFIQGNALDVDLSEYDAVWASPPCQRFTKARFLASDHHEDLIEPVREKLIDSGKPYIIENVPGAPLINPVRLNGQMFGLMVDRERWFECSFPVPFFLLHPKRKAVKMGRPVKDGDVIQVVGHFSNVPYARKAMGIDWMSGKELAQAIPPAFSEFLGRQMMTVFD
jgi:DNA (cytosine-5)-methyltransferase 1